LAFCVATHTLLLQQQQIKEANEATEKTMKQLSAQTSALQTAAEVNGLAAIVQYCDRYAHVDASGESPQQLGKLAAKAKDRLKAMLQLSVLITLKEINSPAGKVLASLLGKYADSGSMPVAQPANLLAQPIQGFVGQPTLPTPQQGIRGIRDCPIWVRLCI
jgi:hypothetical protein